MGCIAALAALRCGKLARTIVELTIAVQVKDRMSLYGHAVVDDLRSRFHIFTIIMLF
jgi:hypothetical protein